MVLMDCFESTCNRVNTRRESLYQISIPVAGRDDMSELPAYSLVAGVLAALA